MPPTRRTVLQGAAVGAVVLAPALAPGEAAAGSERDGAHIRGQLHALRSRQAVIRQEYLDSVYDDRPAAADREVTPHIHALAGGLAALSTVKDIEQMPIEDQMHPGVQRMIRASAAAVGAATARCAELFEVFLTDDSPERETHLRAGLRGVRMSVRDWPTTRGRQHALEQTLIEVEAETNSGALLRRARRNLARIRKAERLAAELEARGETTGVFAIRDAETRARVDAGRARWADEPDEGGGVEYAEPEGTAEEPGVYIALGIVVLGIGCAVGGFLALVGLCAAACGDPTGVFILLAGMAIIGLSIWGGVTLIRKGRRIKRENAAGIEAAADDGMVGPSVVRNEVHVPVLAADGWVDTGLVRAPDTTLHVRGTGIVRFPTRWAADADGNGETGGVDAFVPAAPLGALVGRVGDDVFFLGSEGLVPGGNAGPVLLAVNQRPGDGPPPKGHFAACVTVRVPALG